MIWWCLLLYGLRLEARFGGEGRFVVFLVLFCVGLRSVCPVLFVLCALCLAEKWSPFRRGFSGVGGEKKRGAIVYLLFYRCCSEPVYLKTRRFQYADAYNCAVWLSWGGNVGYVERGENVGEARVVERAQHVLCRF